MLCISDMMGIIVMSAHSNTIYHVPYTVRHLQGLDSLAHHGGGHAVHVINVLFGQSQPSLLSLADSAQQHDTDVSTSIEGAATAPCTLQAFNAGLNDSQRAAVAFALSTDDVALMHGPPGTGNYTLS
jgi:hypothetical protein